MLVGDLTEEIIAKILGKKLVDKIHSKGCKCDERKEYLNKKHRQLIDWYRWKFRID